MQFSHKITSLTSTLEMKSNRFNFNGSKIQIKTRYKNTDTKKQDIQK